MRCRPQDARRRPGCMLSLEEAPELLVRDRDPEVLEQLPHEPRVLDLLEGPGNPEQRLVVLGEAARDRVGIGKAVPPQGSQTGVLTRLDELGVVPELHQRVAPVEEDCAQHDARLATWRAGSSWAR